MIPKKIVLKSFFLASFWLSFLLWASQALPEEEVAHRQTEETASLSLLEQDIDDSTQLISELSKNLLLASGDVKEALQLQLFRKNAELRKSLASAVESETVPKKKLVQLVNTQQTYTREANRFISERIRQLDNQLEQASNEEKLSYVNDYRELQHLTLLHKY